MAEFVEVMKQRDRMCETYFMCEGCGLLVEDNGQPEPCRRFFNEHSQEAEKIIMDWAKEHPVITNADKAREVLGLSKEEFDPCKCFGLTCLGENCEECPKKYFWQQEWKEPKEKADERL